MFLTREFLRSLALLGTMAGIAVSASGCASIMNGTSQVVSVQTTSGGTPVAGASCQLSNDKGTYFVTTPGTVTVHRAYGDMAIKCDKEGMDPGLTTARSSTKALMAGNIIFGGLIGVAIDAGNGAGYDYPDLITVFMGQTTTAVVPPPPSADRTLNPTLAPAPMKAPSGQTADPVAVATAVPQTPATMVADRRMPPTLAPPPAPVPVAPPVQAMTQPAPVAVSATPAAVVAMATPAPGKAVKSTFLFEAEHAAREEGCTGKVTAVASGPALELYTAQCSSGDVLSVRCDYGQCHVTH